MKHFSISDLGPIQKVDIELGDLTFLVGPQASGKSLALETLKLAIDRDSVIATMDRYNYILGHNPEKILNVFYGEGMGGIWKESTHVGVDGVPFTRSSLPKKADVEKEAQVFYMPAQRVVCMGDGTPKSFSDFAYTTPYVMREFAETLRTFVQFGIGISGKVFPAANRIKLDLRERFDSTIFHGGAVVMQEVAGQRKMQLDVDNLHVPFMAWSAGQKEFMPLLLGFYCITGPASKITRRERYHTVIIEEPEMGLHPRAIVSVLLQILELLSLGYQVVVSTHSELLIEWAWTFNLLRGSRKCAKAMRTLLEVEADSKVGRVIGQICTKTVRTYFFDRAEDGRVNSIDISSLDMDSEIKPVSQWGGLASFSENAAQIIERYYEEPR